MSPGVFLVSVISLMAMGGAIVAGGRTVGGNEAEQAVPQADAVAAAPEPPRSRIDLVLPRDRAESIIAARKGFTGVKGHAPMLAVIDPRPPDAPKLRPTGNDVAVALSPMREQARPRVLYRPLARNTGTIDAMGYTIVLVGVEGLQPGEKCRFNGASWPCGARALTEFRNWLRSRAVTCLVPVDPSGRAVITKCRAGRDDAGAWLVGNGWARAQPAGPYAEAGRRAIAEKRGIYGAPWWLKRPRPLPPLVARTPPLAQTRMMARPPTDLSAPSQ